MRWPLYLMMLLLVISLASASSTFIKDEMEEGETRVYETGGGIYILKLLLVSNKKEEAKFELNYEEETPGLKIDGSHGFKDGSEIIVKEILASSQEVDSVKFLFYGTGKGIIGAELPENYVLSDCNFNRECEDETKEDCCYDCGCEEEYRCEKNKCVRTVGCTSDEDCGDKDPCTEDLCKDDKCTYQRKQGCLLDDKCLSPDSIKEVKGTLSYCADNKWNAKKGLGEDCDNEFECLSNMCENNKCYHPKNKKPFFWIITIILIALGVIYARKYKLLKKIKKKLFFRF